MKKVTYDGNEHETYDLILDNEVVAELFLDEDGAMDIVCKINTWLTKQSYINYKDPIIVIKNDNDDLGVIVDIYENNGRDWAEGTTFWFDDFS